MKKKKKIQLRYLLPLIALTLFVVGWILHTAGFNVFCMGDLDNLDRACSSPGSILMLIMIAPGVILEGIIRPLSVAALFPDLYDYFFIAFSFLVYYIIGYLFEKLFNQSRMNKDNS